MSQFHLICNFKKCRQTIFQSAYVTTCSHVFCNEHGLYITLEQDLICPTCDTHLQTLQNITRVNLNPDEVSKSVMLTGFNPELVMDIATRALGFWGYQVNEENLYLEAGLKTANENMAVLKEHCENIHATYRSEINSLQQKIESLNEELEINTKWCQELIHQLQEKTNIINKLQLNAMNKGHSAAKFTAGGTIKQEDSQNHSYLKPSRQSPAVFQTTAFNQFRVPKQEQSPNMPIFTPNCILQQESIRQQQQSSSTPKYFTLFFPKTEDKPNTFSPFPYKTEEPDPFPTFNSLKTEEPNFCPSFLMKNNAPDSFPPFHPLNPDNNMDSSQGTEFNFQPNLDPGGSYQDFHFQPNLEF